MDPRRRVEVGMTVRDADGKKLGKVRRLDPWGFEVVRGFWGPREWVIRYAEVLGVEGGAVRVARSDEALFELASGGLPHAWRRYTPPLATTSLPSAPADGEVEGALLDFFLDEAGKEAIPRRPGTAAVEPVSAHCYTHHSLALCTGGWGGRGSPPRFPPR
jgi:hypothetical protein